MVTRKDAIMKLKDKVALITGAASGIGRETALLFAAEGARVVACDVDDANGQETVARITAAGGKAVYVHADVAKAADCQNMVARAEDAFGALHILFNNAGIMHSGDDNAQITEEDVWDLTMAVNLKGVFLGCKYGIPALRRAGGGSVINTASFVALLGAATPQNVRVNALCPGPLHTELLMKFLDTEEKKQRRLVHIPMGRFGEAKEMAKAARYLASEDASYVTGATFTVDGGITAAYVTPE
jgi:NAD(P)-dependent dehydrogenase (short-subunit alcohol dehydrogenase family)